MHPLRTIRRLALGAAVVMAAVPATASAADITNCSYSSSSGGVVTVNADPFVGDLTLAVVGEIIAVSSGTATGSTPESACFGSGTFARTTNTNRIQVFVNSKLVPTFGLVKYHIDQSRGAFGTRRRAGVRRQLRAGDDDLHQRRVVFAGDHRHAATGRHHARRQHS